MMKRAFEVLWIVNYLQDIRADFFAIYHIPDWEDLDGPLFVSLAERLPMYEGALQGRIKLDNAIDYESNVDTSSDDSYESPQYAPGQSISMSDAVSGNAQLMALNKESNAAGMGNLFEIKTG